MIVLCLAVIFVRLRPLGTVTLHEFPCALAGFARQEPSSSTFFVGHWIRELISSGINDPFWAHEIPVRNAIHVKLHRLEASFFTS